MDLKPPPATRPAEHLLRAHLAHAAHHEQLGEGQEQRLQETIRDFGSAPAEPPLRTAKRPRRRAK